MKRIHLSVISLISLTAFTSAFAAQAIDLNQQSLVVLNSFKDSRLTAGAARTNLEQISVRQDFNQTTHIRVQQMYDGIPVWGGDAVIHSPQGEPTSLSALMAANTRAPSHITMNGTLYQGLNEDLANTPKSRTLAVDKIMQQAVQTYQSQTNLKVNISQQESKPIIFIDVKGQAHRAYIVSFFAKAWHYAAKPTSIIDAITGEVYKKWDNLHTLEKVQGGGIGGNEGKVGKLSYDGSSNHFPALTFMRDKTKKVCYLKNDLTIVNDRNNDEKIPEFSCKEPDATHNNVYWNTINDAVNGGYSADNDVLYSDQIVREMYLKWFNVYMLKDRLGRPLQVTMHVHDTMLGQNAYYDNGTMVFGDGDDESYPVVAPSVVAHEMTHGFTEQYSNLIYESQSGGINEAFSDMADKAIEYYVYGKNNWQIDPELLKTGGQLLRWMDEPTRDCNGRKPGKNCSIDNFKDYYETPGDESKSLNVHFSSGLFNKAFYLIATNWNNDTHKAFNVMTKANMDYWTSTTTFADAACGVIKATRDYRKATQDATYDETVVIAAMKAVGVEIDLKKCK